jgi:hypothetical protein
VHARLVRIRERMIYRSRIGKMLASLRAIISAAVRPPDFEAEIQTGNGRERLRVSGIAVSNNPLGEGHIPHADRLDAGRTGCLYGGADVDLGADQAGHRRAFWGAGGRALSSPNRKWSR